MRRSVVAAGVVLGAVVAVSGWALAAGFRSDAGRQAVAHSTAFEAVLGVTATGSPATDAPTQAPSPIPTAEPSATPTEVPTPTPPPTPAPTRTRSPTPAPIARAVPRGSGVRTVTLGDSLTAWPTGNPWPSRLDAEDPAVSLVHNAGVPGNVTAQMLARFGYDVARYSPGLLIVMGGTNDIGHGIAQSTTIANLRAIVEAGKANGMTVVLLTIPPNSFTGEIVAVRSLNVAIRSLAAAEGVAVIDIYTPLATASGVYKPGYTVDGLHFSNVAAQVVADTVRAGLAAIGL